MRLGERLVAVEGIVHGWLVRHSIMALRISMGLVFLGFGVLKFFPGVSPAEDLVVTTTRLLTFGLVPDPVALVITATLEVVIGLALIAGRGMRVVIYLLATELLGILSPVVLLTDRLFSGPFHAPTLEGQYVLKDIVLVTAAMVVATAFRGATITLRSTTDHPHAAPRHRRPVTADERMAVVLSGLRGEHSVAALCRRHHISAEEYTAWRVGALRGATAALAVERSVPAASG